MKKLLFAIAILFSVTSFAQKSDTLNVPVGKYKFIKIGDRVYEIETKLKEVEQGIPTWEQAFIPKNSYLPNRILIDSTGLYQLYNQSNLSYGTAPYYGNGDTLKIITNK